MSAAENRRWLIGVGISFVFGLFGAVMALLSYLERGKPAARPAVGATVAPAPAAAPAPRGHKKRGRD